MSLHELSLEEKVHSLLEEEDQLVDPYSAAVVAIKGGLSYGIEHNEAMNDHELAILRTIELGLYTLDPMANPNYLAPGITGPFIPDTPSGEEE